MTNLLLLLFFVACIGSVAAWLAENPGSVTIYWFDWRIDTSFAFLLLAAMIAAFVIAYGWILLRRLILAPKRLSQARQIKHYRHGLAELTHSVAALATGDTANAEAHTKKAQKLLGPTPLTLLLSAQSARNRGDDEKTRHLLGQMLEHKETEYLAARSLSEAASQQQLFPKALALARRAQALNPQASVQVISLHMRLGEWQEAMAAIDKATRRGQLARAQRQRYKGMVHLRQGMDALKQHRNDAALMAAKCVLKELPEFAPALDFAAQAFAAGGNAKKAEKLRAAMFMPSVWTCAACGHNASAWGMHCGTCGGFDTLSSA